MYQVSEAFREEMKRKQRVEHIRGLIGDIVVDDHNFLDLEYSNRCTDTRDVTFGSAYIGQIVANLINVNIPRGSWRGLPFSLSYGLELDDDVVEWVPVGVFTISEAVWTDHGIKVTASDILAKLDIAFNAGTTYGTLYDLLAYAAKMTGIELGQTEAELNALPNATDQLGLYPNNDITTFRDFVSWLASACGGFATANREGKLIIKSWGDLETVDTITAHDRIVGSNFSDYSTSYSGISLEDQESGGLEYYIASDAVGTVIALGNNPFLQYGVTDVKTAQRQALADVAASIRYTPFSISLLNCPVYDLGDLIVCDGGIAGDEPLTCAVMAINWQLKQTIELKGIGADPSLTSGKNKTDKALAGLKNKTSENEVVTHTFVNSQALTLKDDVEAQILKIMFSTVKPKVVSLFHEINLDLTITDESGIASCTAYYYLNGVLEGYQPVATWNNDGKHILSLMYFLKDLLSGSSNEWVVKLKIDGGTATIGRGDIHAILQGQGLVALGKFDGLIELSDEYEPLTLGIPLADLSDRLVSIEKITPIRITASDTISPYVLGIPLVELAEGNMTLIAKPVQFTRVLEDEETERITEDGESIRLTEV